MTCLEERWSERLVLVTQRKLVKKVRKTGQKALRVKKENEGNKGKNALRDKKKGKKQKKGWEKGRVPQEENEESLALRVFLSGRDML